MKRSRAIFMAILITVAAAFNTAEVQAGPPLSSTFDFGRIVAQAAQPADDAQGDPTHAHEPVSMALFGIGISSFITLRRFRKLFN